MLLAALNLANGISSRLSPQWFGEEQFSDSRKMEHASRSRGGSQHASVSLSIGLIDMGSVVSSLLSTYGQRHANRTYMCMLPLPVEESFISEPCLPSKTKGENGQ